MTATLVHLSDPFNPTRRKQYSLSKRTTVRRLVQRHKGLRPHTRIYRPGGPYQRRQVREFSRPTICLLRGAPVLRKDWAHTVVEPGDVIVFATSLNPKGGGGGGGGGGSNPLSIVLMIAVIAATIYLGPQVGLALGPTGLGLFGASTALAVGNAVVGLALGALAYGIVSLFASPAPPPPTTTTGYGGGTPASSPTYNLQAQGQYNRLGQPIEELLGRSQIFPSFVETPYITYDDNNPVLHHVLGISIGEVDIDETSLKLGTTGIASYFEDDGVTPAIDWAKIEPGDLSDITIADERWITNTDVTDVLLPDSAAGSPWQGPYATGAQATVSRVQLDYGAPRGLWHFNTGTGGFDARTVNYSVRGQLIDDVGVPVGDPSVWTDLGSFSKTNADQTVLRWTDEIVLPEAGRWQIEVQRTDTQDTDANAGHELHLIGMKGKLISRRTYPGMTCIALKMTASGSLTQAQSRAFNLVCTRKLETWDPSLNDGAGGMTTARSATTSPCDAFAYIARTTNGADLDDSQIDLAGLYAQQSAYAGLGWNFNFVFDSQVTQNEALSRVARAVLGAQVVQGGKLRLVRDQPSSGPVAMFSPRNIKPGTLDVQYAMVDNTTADALVGNYIDDRIWAPATLTAAFDDSAQERPSNITLYGVTNAAQAWAGLWWMARQNRYRRRTVTIESPMEGLAVLFADPVSFSHDVPKWGQTLEVLDFDDSAMADDGTGPLVLTVSDPPAFTSGDTTFYAAVRDSKGRKAGPFVATPVEGRDDRLTLTVTDPGSLPEMLVGGDAERTWIQFGPGELYSKPLKVKSVQPRDEWSAQVVLIDDDPRMHADLPPIPSTPIGAPTDPITIHVSADVAGALNLRSLADDNDYVGVSSQQVTIIVDDGIETGQIVRGSWPRDYMPILVNKGIITGPGGIGGAGANPSVGGPGGAGTPGGDAIDTRSGPLSLDNSAGAIRGGGGGGGGGAYGATADDSGTTPLAGGGGGGGRGRPGGSGGAGGTQPGGGSGTAGTSGNESAPGNGGHGTDDPVTGTGGNGGDFGQPGQNGASGSFAGFTTTAGGPGGAAGKAISGIANVTFVGVHGIIIGPTA